MSQISYLDAVRRYIEIRIPFREKPSVQVDKISPVGGGKFERHKRIYDNVTDASLLRCLSLYRGQEIKDKGKFVTGTLYYMAAMPWRAKK